MECLHRVTEEAAWRVRWARHELDRIRDETAEDMPVANRRGHEVVNGGRPEVLKPSLGHRARRLHEVDGDGLQAIAGASGSPGSELG